MNRSSRVPSITLTTHAAAPPAPARAIFRRFRTFPSPSVVTLSSAVSAPPPRTRERVGLRECTTISTEFILATDRDLRPRLGESGGAAGLLVLEGNAAVLRNLASERRLREEEAGAGAGAGAPALPALLFPASLSGARGVWVRARAAVDDVAAAVAALGLATVVIGGRVRGGQTWRVRRCTLAFVAVGA
jgi:nitroreductase